MITIVYRRLTYVSFLNTPCIGEAYLGFIFGPIQYTLLTGSPCWITEEGNHLRISNENNQKYIDKFEKVHWINMRQSPGRIGNPKKVEYIMSTSCALTI